MGSESWWLITVKLSVNALDADNVIFPSIEPCGVHTHTMKKQFEDPP